MCDPAIASVEASAADRNAAGARAAGPILTIRGVHQRFNARSGEVVTALDNINLEIAAGEFVAFVGISGCGKTTLMKIVGGLISPTEGDIIYKGERVTGPIDDLGIVFQKPVLLEWRTVLRNITLQTSMRGLGSATEQRRRAEDLLERVGLAGYGDRFPWELSGGQQQRVSLCRALVHKPGLLLMDEPFGALDALTREQLQRDLERMWLAQRPTVLFVTHDVGEAVCLADRVVVLAGKPGRVVANIAVGVGRARDADLLNNPKLQAYAKEVRSVLLPNEPNPDAVLTKAGLTAWQNQVQPTGANSP
jgi:NitT/TauT family transport system ATP-binding protein